MSTLNSYTNLSTTGKYPTVFTGALSAPCITTQRLPSPHSISKNENGYYTSCHVNSYMTSLTLAFNSTNGFIQRNNYAVTTKINEGIHDDKYAYAIIAIPKTSEWSNVTNYNFIYDTQLDTANVLLSYESKALTYMYFIARKPLISTPSETITQLISNATNQFLIENGTGLNPNDFPQRIIYNRQSNLQLSNVASLRTLKQYLTNINSYGSNTPSGRYNFSKSVYTSDAIASCDAFSNVEDDNKVILAQAIPVGINNWLLYPFGSDITANIPIFDIRNTDGIIKYFNLGIVENAINDTDLILSKINLATDWTVYVKGNNAPDITLTAKCQELEDFIADTTQNTSGLSLDDFKIHIILRETRLNNDAFEMIHGSEFSTEVFEYIVNEYYLPYNQNWVTSWRAITEQTYGVYDVNNTISAVAHFEFRLEFQNDYFSAWQECNIGYIGNPDLPDFEKMNNYGGAITVNDGSTVTIIYNELPEDNDYIKPDRPSNIGDTDPRTNSVLGLNLLTRTYKITRNKVNELGNFFWQTNFKDKILQLNNSPIENLVGLKIMPCSASGSASTIKIGNVDTEISGDIVANIDNITIGSINFTGTYGNFLDYGPYTQSILFLPYIGFVNIDPNKFTNHVLTVIYSFDVILGYCKAMLYADNIYVESHDGTCGIDVPLTSTNRATVEAGLVTTAIGGAADVLSGGGAEAAIKGVGKFASEWIGRQYHSSRSGSYSPVLGWIEPNKCYLCLIQPNAQYPQNYGHLMGYPCNLSAYLGSLRGYTEVDSGIDLSGIPCTETERDMIRQILSEGVYL